MYCTLHAFDISLFGVNWLEAKIDTCMVAQNLYYVYSTVPVGIMCLFYYFLVMVRVVFIIQL